MSDTSVPQCERKRQYKHRKEAAQALTRLKKGIIRSTEMAEPLEVYHCDYHHCFHIGHPVGWRREVGLPRTDIRRSLGALG
jgi:hypothetical protein